MTIHECYERLHGDYASAKKRLMSDRLIDKLLLKFPSDDSITILRNAIAAGNIQEMFRGAHTLKGVSGNLSFMELQKASSELTEQLRSCDQVADPKLYEKVEQCYALVIETIAAYSEEKA